MVAVWLSLRVIALAVGHRSGSRPARRLSVQTFVAELKLPYQVAVTLPRSASHRRVDACVYAHLRRFAAGHLDGGQRVVEPGLAAA